MSLADVITALAPALESHGLSIEGSPRIRPDGFDHQIGLRNKQGVRVVLTLTFELVEDSASSADAARVVERSDALTALSAAVSSKNLGVKFTGAVFEL